MLIKNSKRREWVPCGKCNFCLQSKRADWSFRIQQEQKISIASHFLTLTYDERTIPRVPIGDSRLDKVETLKKEDLQLFIKRLRESNRLLSPTPLRYYSVGEYGSRTLRPHYHAIIFNLDSHVLNRVPEIWGLGHIHIGECSPASIHYVTKYVINRETNTFYKASGIEKPFSLMSRRPGLGAAYIQTHAHWHKAAKRNFTKINGQIGKLPRYYATKIFNDSERHRMALKNQLIADDLYLEEISRLESLHPDAHNHYDERILYAHERVTSKINDLSKI